MSTMRLLLVFSLGMTVASSLTGAATLPPHAPMRILIVSDEVNPHGLPPGDLTQPGELSATLLAGAGIDLDRGPDAVLEIPTDQIELATVELQRTAGDPLAYDALIYFAHRIPNGANAGARQAEFTAAVEAFLQSGGGVVSFHHGSYLTAGKEAIQEIIGVTATGNVPWNTVDGQNVIDVAAGHFVTTNGLDYSGTVAYADPSHGVVAGTYSFFNNTPDERYINFDLDPGAEQVRILFGSDYADNGTTHLLGITHQRADWSGRVVVYQPGEYEPNALDVSGNNFQILANALVWSSRALSPAEIVLLIDRGSGTDEVLLTWLGGYSPFTVHAASGPQQVATPENEIADTLGSAWSTVAPGALIFFVVTDSL